jgi:mannonate dehydratase
MEQTWRWYGPKDPVTLLHVKQSGATGIVTALHHVPIGEVWTIEAINERKAEIEAVGLTWSVVESVPVHEAIKQGTAERDAYITKYQESVRNLGKCGLNILCYNFMPVIDWTRTDLEYEWSDGSRALAFDADDFAAFELCILKRPGASEAYDAAATQRAKARFDEMSEERRAALQACVTAGLPGKMTDAYTLDAFQTALDAYKTVDADALRANLAYFLKALVPVAEVAGVYMAIHPDDPPRPLLGLPRVVSTASDVRALLDAAPSAHNGLTFCVGSYASSPVNDVEDMAAKLAKHVFFVHLRNVKRSGATTHCSFVESDHLDGEVDMYAIMRTFTAEAARRRASGASAAACRLPFRPDHGHKMLDDLSEGKATNPGYTAIGRLRGLAELRGLQEAIVRQANDLQRERETADLNEEPKRPRRSK